MFLLAIFLMVVFSGVLEIIITKFFNCLNLDGEKLGRNQLIVWFASVLPSKMWWAAGRN